MEAFITKTSKFEVKDFSDDSRTVKGYASVFSNLDSDSDVIQKGSFNRTIKAWGPEGKDRIKLMAQHDMSRPIAKITKLMEDPNGLYIEAKFGTHTDGDDYYRMTKEGIINEFSVGFQAVEKDDNDAGGYDFKEVKLYEVSMVSIAANDAAVVTDVKSANPLNLLKQIEDEDLAFKLERELLKLMSKADKASTQPETDLAVTKVSPDAEAVTKTTIINQLLELYKPSN